MCNCIKEVEDSFEKHFINEFNPLQVINCDLQNSGYAKQSEILFGTLRIKYTKKNKKNEVKVKNYTSNVYFEYCPFCGKKYEEEN